MSVWSRAAGGAWRPAALGLVAELERLGLVAEVRGSGLVRVHNPAGGPDPDDPQGQAFAPGLGQEVVCRRRDGVLWWDWVWPGPSCTSPPELEPLCPVADVVTAVTRIARVVAVPFVGSPASPSPASSGSSGSFGSFGSSGGCG
ncbi:hypothetical protein [Actinomadura bangladeshensis]|uniref:hypothetical protein n=1 Tax=Actinomadura bangladeshensis TaxID=453573 RepID=UPI00105028AB|nr:hypothetical protein [Actinomadura bangladeshensis]